jgi:DNA-directed RNA polymerase specialized sigma subunit
MNGTKKGAAGLAPSGTSHDEVSETINERAINNSRRPFFEGGDREEGSGESAKIVPIVNGWRETAFDSEPADILAHMTPRERTTWELRVAALRYIAQIEPRSFHEIADELGVTIAAVSRVYRDVLARIGCRQIFDNAEKRWKLAEAAGRTLNSKRKAA